MYKTNYSGPTYYARENNLMYRVYGWMCLALALTAFTAYYVASTPAIIQYIFSNQFIVWGLFLVQLGLVFALTLFIQRMSAATALALFILYSLFSGITFSTIFLVYTMASIASTFIVASGMFGAMALYGYFTKSDLTSMGSFLFMALIGLIIGTVVNLFFKSASFNYLLSAAGVIIFTLLTAYDVQKIKRILEEQNADKQTMFKMTLIGALALYLDFINLFLMLLQLLGNKREE